jgi:hypothetical protein
LGVVARGADIGFTLAIPSLDPLVSLLIGLLGLVGNAIWGASSSARLELALLHPQMLR